MAAKNIKSRARRITKFEVAAFVTGFSLLAYELVAARILAPSIGSSTYVWTSVIGVIIAALSAGYAAGGMLADKRVKSYDIAWLLLLAAGGVVATLAMSDTMLNFMTSNFEDPRIQGLLVATILFSPTSFILGMISPYLARLRTVSLETTGTSVAFLSAANAFGGITGTFGVGFIFFGYIGANETLFFTAALLIMCAFLFAPYRQMLKGVGVGSLMLMSVFAVFTQSYAEGQVADINTPDARYQVFDIGYNGAPARVLVAGPGAIQSGVRLDGSNELVFMYTQQMAALVDQAPKKNSILILGGGAFTLPNHLAQKYPSSRVDVVEIDPRLVGIAKQYFGYKDHKNITIYAEDARAYVNQTQKKYDIILVDVYSDTSIPFSVATQEYAKRLKANLKPDGVVLSNIIGSDAKDCKPLLRAIHASYADSFKYYLLYPQEDPSLVPKQNIIFAYSNRPLQDDNAISRDLSGGLLMTDNYAPVERLKLQCK